MTAQQRFTNAKSAILRRAKTRQILDSSQHVLRVGHYPDNASPLRMRTLYANTCPAICCGHETPHHPTSRIETNARPVHFCSVSRAICQKRGLPQIDKSCSISTMPDLLKPYPATNYAIGTGKRNSPRRQSPPTPDARLRCIVFLVQVCLNRPTNAA